MERTIKPQDLKLAGKHLIDVRRAADRDVSAEQIPGARWHDPAQIAEWVGALPKDKEIVLYCVRGGSVSNGVVDTLRAAGLDAGFIEGGMEAWKAVGGEVNAK
ncbi:MAG: sulfurtransferase [Sterolibacteriaceae bacterium]|uniref:rhodanese-like domain-containing protein n=1 Tax=Sulfuritalea sp. TaxID=2480090 RepID=UPI001A3755AE|nr:rhodanese-like domain-containing protein [Sulfuritalea sp.]MBL8479670.1 sulfurtransferase [Sterolibacteriaceae bacterium]MBN8476110.1 sulfurtransferase [Sulfuritalea sp.]